MRVLVGYASAKGSTREIAERIATRLRAAGHVTAVDSVDQASAIASYDALVLGSAIHNGQWLPEAMAAVTCLPSGIENLPVWAFSVSSIGATSSTVSPALARMLRARTPLPKAVQHLQELTDLRAHRFFAGAIARGDWPGVGRIAFRLMGGRYGDARDWADVAAWADGIANDLARQAGPV